MRVAVSVDGLPEHHDIRREPATYERILKNIAGRKINVHWVITQPMLGRPAILRNTWLSGTRGRSRSHLGEPLQPADGRGEPRDCLRPRIANVLAQRTAAFAEKISQAAVPGGHGTRFVNPPSNPQRLPVLQDVGELLGRSGKPGGTLRLRRNSGLHPVRLQHQQRPALDSE